MTASVLFSKAATAGANAFAIFYDKNRLPFSLSFFTNQRPGDDENGNLVFSEVAHYSIPMQTFQAFRRPCAFSMLEDSRVFPLVELANESSPLARHIAVNGNYQSSASIPESLRRPR